MKGLKILAMLLAATCCLSACAGGGDISTPTTESSAASQGGESSAPETSEEETLGEFETVFRFVVTSDNHVSSVNDASAKRLAQLFKSTYAYAET